MFEVNVMSGVRLTRHYLKGMLEEKKWGRVVFVSSELAIFVPKEMVHYGFSKAAQLVIARGAAEMTKGTNVTVNSVLPGPTWVEMAPVRLAARAKGLGTTAEELAARTFTERRPQSLLQRYASPEEIANLICYVCSKASSATNGAASAPTAASSPIRSRMALMWALAVAVIYFGSFLAIGIIVEDRPAGTSDGATGADRPTQAQAVAGSARPPCWAPGVRGGDVSSALPLRPTPAPSRASPSST